MALALDLNFAKFKEITGSAGEFLPADFSLRSLASLEHAGEGDVVVVIERGDASVFDALSKNKITATKAACVIAAYDILPGRTCVVSDALDAYQKIINFTVSRDARPFVRDERYTHAFVSRDAFVAPDVVVEPGVVVMPGASIANGSKIEAQAYIGSNAVVGEHVHIHPSVKILDRCLIGDHSIIHAGAVIGGDGFGYQVTKVGLRKLPHVGIVRIGKYVEVGANATIDRALFDETIVDDGTKLGCLVSIAHNAKIGKSCAILTQTCVGGGTTIGTGCLIGAQVAIKDNIIIADRVKIVSKSGVIQNIEKDKVVGGIPTLPFTEWKKIQVITRQLPTFVRQVKDMIERRSWWRVVIKNIRLLIGR